MDYLFSFYDIKKFKDNPLRLSLCSLLIIMKMAPLIRLLWLKKWTFTMLRDIFHIGLFVISNGFYNILWFQDFFHFLQHFMVSRFYKFLQHIMVSRFYLVKNVSHFHPNGETSEEVILLRLLDLVIEAMWLLFESKRMPKNLERSCD